VRAIRAGAIDFLPKPVDPVLLLVAVRAALELNERQQSEHESRGTLLARFSELTEREREVLAHVICGRLNKQTGASLGVTEKTVKVHRARMMQKLGVRTVPDLIRLADSAGALSHSPRSPLLVTWDWDMVHDEVIGSRALRRLFGIAEDQGA